MVIADRFVTPDRFRIVRALIRSGVVPWIQLRDHDAAAVAFEAAVRAVADLVAEEGVETVLSVNGPADLARELGLGLHVGFRGLPPVEARERIGNDIVLGYSLHQGDERTVIAPCDYVTYSPVFPVRKSPSRPTLRLEGVSKLADVVSIPLYALGGVTVERAGPCIEAGAYGVAVSGGIMDATDPTSAVRDYLSTLRHGVSLQRSGGVS